MFEKMLSFVCCCFPTEPSPPPPPIKHKHYKHRTNFIISCPSSTPCYLSPIIIPCTPTITDSSQHPFCEDSTMSSNYDSTTMTTDVSSLQQLPSQSARVSAIRELIETEQRYVKDLRIVANDFIKPLTNNRILNDCEIEQLFSNWFNLIACNAVLLSSLQGQVQYREHIVPLDDDDDDLSTRSTRSVSMTNIALVAKANIKDTFVSHLPHSPSLKEIAKHRTIARPRHHSPSSSNLKLKRPASIERLDDNLVPQVSQISITSTMTIDESTCIGEILCSYLPYMADAYFDYCNRRSQANKHLQSKTDKNKDFYASILLFQKSNAGLSLNGFLMKPMQRVTRYPLLIEKILKHTLNDHPDHEPIQRALARAREINSRIDKQISEQENYVRLDWLQQRVIFGTDEHSADGYIFDELVKFNSSTKYHAQRQLLLHGLLTKLPSGKELLVFLFNDFILLTTMKSTTSQWQNHLFEAKSNLQLKLYRSPILLTDIIKATESNNDPLTFCLETKTFKKPLNLKTELLNVRTLWVRSILNAMDECNTFEKPSISIIQPEPVVAYLNLIVQEALITLSTPPSVQHRAFNSYCEIIVCDVSLKTPFVRRTTNPKWGTPMQFALTNLQQNNIHINLFDHQFFSPDENIGYMTANILDILPCPLDEFQSQSSHAFCHKIYLNNGVMITLQCAVEFLSFFQ